MPHTSTRRGTDIQIRTGITAITTGITTIERQIADQKIDWHSTPMPMGKPRLLPGFFLCAEHDRQLGGGSPLPSLMVAKG